MNHLFFCRHLFECTAEGLARRPALGIPKGDACYHRDARRGKSTDPFVLTKVHSGTDPFVLMDRYASSVANELLWALEGLVENA